MENKTRDKMEIQQAVRQALEDEAIRPTQGEPLTPDQARAIAAWAKDTAKKRRAERGEAFHEDDYVVGVMTAYFALRSQGSIPAPWIFATLGGRSAFGLDPLPPRKEGRHGKG